MLKWQERGGDIELDREEEMKNKPRVPKGPGSKGPVVRPVDRPGHPLHLAEPLVDGHSLYLDRQCLLDLLLVRDPLPRPCRSHVCAWACLSRPSRLSLPGLPGRAPAKKFELVVVEGRLLVRSLLLWGPLAATPRSPSPTAAPECQIWRGRCCSRRRFASVLAPRPGPLPHGLSVARRPLVRLGNPRHHAPPTSPRGEVKHDSSTIRHCPSGADKQERRKHQTKRPADEASPSPPYTPPARFLLFACLSPCLPPSSACRTPGSERLTSPASYHSLLLKLTGVSVDVGWSASCPPPAHAAPLRKFHVTISVYGPHKAADSSHVIARALFRREERRGGQELGSRGEE